MIKTRTVEKMVVGSMAAWVLVLILALAGWITNIIELFQKHNSFWEIAIGIAGVPLGPVGAIRGIGHWFGAW